MLSILGLSKSVTMALSSAVGMGLAIALATEDLLMNLFLGITMTLKSPFNIGDFVETNSHIGSVPTFSLRSA